MGNVGWALGEKKFFAAEFFFVEKKALWWRGPFKVLSFFCIFFSLCHPQFSFAGGAEVARTPPMAYGYPPATCLPFCASTAVQWPLDQSLASQVQATVTLYPAVLSFFGLARQVMFRHRLASL